MRIASEILIYTFPKDLEPLCREGWEDRGNFAPEVFETCWNIGIQFESPDLSGLARRLQVRFNTYTTLHNAAEYSGCV